MPGFELEGWLFHKHINHVRADTSMTGFNLLLDKPNGTANNQTIYVYEQDDTLYLETKDALRLNISGPIAQVDPQATAYIVSALNGTNFLSNHAYELINFIAANHSVSSDPYMIGRSIVKYENSWPKLASSTTKTFSAFCPEEQEFLQSLVERPGPFGFEELLSIKYKILFQFILEDRALYTQASYKSYRKERFGMFYRNHAYLTTQIDDCIVDNPEEEERRANKRRDELQKIAYEFFANESISKKIRNPAYLLQQAYSYERIDIEQPKAITGNFTFRGAYGLLKTINPRCAVKPKEEGYFANFIITTAQKFTDAAYTIGSTILSNPTGLFKVFKQLFSGEVALSELYLPNPLNLAVASAEEAVRADLYFNWWAYNALSYLMLRRDGEKIRAYSQSEQAGNVINDFATNTKNFIESISKHISQLEMQLGILIQQKIIASHTDLALQLKTEIEMYKVIVRVHQENLKLVQEAVKNFKRKKPSIIRVGKILEFVDLVNNTAIAEFANTTDRSIAANFTELRTVPTNFSIYARTIASEMYAEGGFVQAAYLEKLRDDRDWTDTFISGMFGAFFIVLGIALMPVGGVFMTTFATSLIAGGVADIVSSIAAIINGNPIEIEQYLKSKLISTGIAVLTAGILHGLAEIRELNMLFSISAGAKKFATGFHETLELYLTTQFAFAGASQLIGTVLQQGADEYVKKNLGEAKRSTRSLIENIMQANYDLYLRRVLAYDLMTGQSKGSSLIESAAALITKDYSKRFRSTEAQVARGVAGQTIGKLAGGLDVWGQVIGSAFSTGLETGLGVIKFQEAEQDFEPEINAKIKDVAANTPGTFALMGTVLAGNSNSAVRNKAAEIMKFLSTTSFVVGDEIHFENCGMIAGLELGGFASFIEPITASCERVNFFMSKDNQQQLYTALQDNLASTLFNSLQSIANIDIASPIANIATSTLAGLAVSPLQAQLDAAKKKIAEAQKGQQQEYQEQQESIDLSKLKKKQSAVPPKLKIHEVVVGDTISGIAADNKISEQELIEANPWLKDRKDLLIKAGVDRLVIPQKGPTQPPQSSNKQPKAEHAQQEQTNTQQDKQKQVKHYPGKHHKPNKEVLAVFSNAESAYKKSIKSADEALEAQKVNSNHKTIHVDSDASTGAQMSVVKRTNSDGSTDILYNAAGMADTAAEWLRDVPSGATVATSGSTAGKTADSMLAGARSATACGAASPFAPVASSVREKNWVERYEYMRKTPGWDQVADQVNWHINEMDAYNRATGNTKPFVFNGHSLGGSIGIVIAVLRPDLVKVVNAIDSPGAMTMLQHLTSASPSLVANVYGKVTLYNAAPNIVNTIGFNPKGITVHMINSQSHSLDKIIRAYNFHGSTETTTNIYTSGGVFDSSTGRYIIQRLYTATVQDVAQELSLPAKMITRVEDIVGVPGESGKSRFIIQLTKNLGE